MKKLLFIVTLTTSFIAQAGPYKIVAVADEDAVEKAEEFKRYLKTKPPFSRMKDSEFIIEVVTISKTEMNCGNRMAGSPRVIVCNDAMIARAGAQRESNLTIAFTSSATGGSGGPIPKASKDYPIQTMFHEMLHTYSFDDEYTYSESEAEMYCKNPRSRGNGAYFQDTPPYSSDPGARQTHTRDVPWMGGIEVKTLITQGSSLGSKETVQAPGQQILGLYRGGACDKKIPSWRPYLNSIMRNFRDDTVYPLYEEIIVQNIETSIGRRLKLEGPSVEKDDCPHDHDKKLTGELKSFDDILKKIISN
jgi:hypothetical protein